MSASWSSRAASILPTVSSQVFCCGDLQFCLTLAIAVPRPDGYCSHAHRRTCPAPCRWRSCWGERASDRGRIFVHRAAGAGLNRHTLVGSLDDRSTAGRGCGQAQPAADHYKFLYFTTFPKWLPLRLPVAGCRSIPRAGCTWLNLSSMCIMVSHFARQSCIEGAEH